MTEQQKLLRLKTLLHQNTCAQHNKLKGVGPNPLSMAMLHDDICDLLTGNNPVEEVPSHVFDTLSDEGRLVCLILFLKFQCEMQLAENALRGAVSKSLLPNVGNN